MPLGAYDEVRWNIKKKLLQIVSSSVEKTGDWSGTEWDWVVGMSYLGKNSRKGNSEERILRLTSK